MADLSKVDVGVEWASSGSVDVPADVKLEVGWIPGEVPPAEYQNWWQRKVDKTISYLYQKGVPEWSNSQEYIKDKSVVLYQGDLYTCTNTHTNQPPNDTNFWKNIASSNALNVLRDSLYAGIIDPNTTNLVKTGVYSTGSGGSFTANGISVPQWATLWWLSRDNNNHGEQLFIKESFMGFRSIINSSEYATLYEVFHTGNSADIRGKNISTSTSLGSSNNNIPTQKAVKDYVDNKVQEAVPTGTIAWFPKNSIPSGWLKCNGATVSSGTYSALYGVIGTTFGGDSSNFNLPDLRGEFIRGWDDGRGVDSGRGLGSSQGQMIQSHNHGGSTGNFNTSHTHTGTTSSVANHTHTGTTSNQDKSHSHAITVSGSGTHTHSGTTGNQSNDHTHSGTSSTAGNHSHSGTTNSTGNHSHSGTAASAGAHTHSVGYWWRVQRGFNTGKESKWESNNNRGESVSYSTDSDGAHTHSISTNTTGNHSHTISTNTTGNHNHTLTTGKQSTSHTHSFSIGSSGGHSHSASSGNQSSSHKHTFTTSSDGGHNHSFTTASGGSNHSHSIPSDGGAETRPRNVALIAMIKYL